VDLSFIWPDVPCASQRLSNQSVNGRAHYSVIKPVNYFLVLTSIIVHGVTIPVGKGFQHARTLTMSRSNTGLVGSNTVSRLPTPVPIPPGAALPLANARSGNEIGMRESSEPLSAGGMAVGVPDTATIRFREPDKGKVT